MNCPEPPPGEDEHRLLVDVQAYLHQRLSAGAPDSVLCLSWEQFYRTYDKILRHFAASLHLKSDDRDEVVQLVWCQLLTSLSEFEWSPNRSGLRSYLFALVHNKAMDIIRERHPGVMQSLSSLSGAGADLIDPDASPLGVLEKKFELSVVATALAELKSEVSEFSYRVFHLRAIEGKSVDEVVSMLGVGPESVWQRYHRVLQKVRRRVQVYCGPAYNLHRSSRERGARQKKT